MGLINKQTEIRVMKILEINMPEISVYCPECNQELFINGAEFETGIVKYYGIANACCDNCDHDFTVGLI